MYLLNDQMAELPTDQMVRCCFDIWSVGNSAIWSFNKYIKHRTTANSHLTSREALTWIFFFVHLRACPFRLKSVESLKTMTYPAATSDDRSRHTTGHLSHHVASWSRRDGRG